MARSRSGTRGRRGPRKPPRRDGASRRPGPGRRPARARRDRAADDDHRQGARGAAGVNPADVIRELIKSGIFATINQLIDRDTASLVAGELGYEVAETVAPTTGTAPRATSEAPAPATKEVLFEEDDPRRPRSRAPRS